ncbi:ATP-binding protein [Isoptericola halotolerans]|uniref:ATP-binding protein n=1 Tax=Isoptericola halotolerans TaxID=300560 RepID=UPI003890BE76
MLYSYIVRSSACQSRTSGVPVSEADVAQTLEALRRIRGEPERVEVNRAAQGVPAGLRETLSAFSNTDGGTVLLGVDEAADFAVVELPDAVALRDSVARMARDDLTPALRVTSEIVEVEGRFVVAVTVPPVEADRRPVYVTTKGVSTGSYLRTSDGDRRMTEAEVGLLFASRVQPRYDHEVVPGTTVADLDRDALARTLQRVRRSSTALARAEEHVVLRRIGVTADADPRSALTLAGLLTFGTYPQERFPQLMATVVVHPAESDGEVRFLDSAAMRGPIPEIVQGTLDLLRRHLAARAVMSDQGRTDQLEFPLLAVREAVVNALLHRDYSGVTRGTQVQVDLHPDRLEIRSPGGLYGGVSVEDLGEEGVTSSRNAVLASLLSDAYMPGSAEIVAENRSSGVPTMVGLARAGGLPRPVFRSAVSTFVVTMNRSQLLGHETRRWIAGLRLPGLTSAHEVALAMLRQGSVSNAALRQWGVDRVDASRVLRQLVERGVAVKEGGRRYATYVLDPQATASPSPSTTSAETSASAVDSVTAAVRGSGRAVRASEIEDATGLRRPTVVRHLNALVARGLVEALGATRSPQRRYRWVGP